MRIIMERKKNRSSLGHIGCNGKHHIAAAWILVLMIGILLTGCVFTNAPPAATNPTQTSDTPSESTTIETSKTDDTNSEPIGTDSTVQEGTTPEDTEPEDTEPERTEMTDTTPETTEPIVTNPIQTTPPTTDPEDTVPVTTEPEDTTPVTTEPADTDPIPDQEIRVESISLSAPKTTIVVREQVKITAAILPENADVLTVMYRSTGGQVLDNGVFSADQPGVYVITAEAMDDSGVSATITIVVEAAPVTGITITGTNTVTVGKTLQLKATVSPEYATNPDVTWSIIAGNNVATIDQNGLLNALVPGKATVQATAKDGSGVKATYTVEVTPVLVSSITISGETKVTIGNTLQLKATVKPTNATNAAVTWSITSGGSYATINQNGLLTAVAPGKVTV